MRWLAIILFIGGCAPSIHTACPPPIWIDEKVAEELDTIPFEGYEDLWDYLAAQERQDEQLEACQ